MSEATTRAAFPAWPQDPSVTLDGSSTAVADQDRAWVEQCLAGDEAGYGHLLHRYRQGIHNLAHRMLGNSEDANDVAQEAFVRAFTALDKYDARFKFSSWLYRIATNLCVDTLRKRRVKTVSLEEGDEEGRDLKSRLADRNSDPSDAVLRGERSALIRRALEKLDAKYRAVILLRHDQDLSYEEMASILGLPVGTVKVRVHRARERLRDLLAPYMDEL